MCPMCVGDFFFHVSMTGCDCDLKTSKLVLKKKTFLYSLRNINTVIFNIKEEIRITFNKHCGTLKHIQM